MKKNIRACLSLSPWFSFYAAVAVSALTVTAAHGQTTTLIYNNNTGDLNAAVNGNFSTGPYNTTTPGSGPTPTATTAVQINSVTSGNQVLTDDVVAGTTIFSLNINEDVAGVSNLFSETGNFGASNASNNLLVLNAGSSNALSISATGSGTGAIAGISIAGNSTNTSNAQTVLGLGGSNGTILLNATTGNTAELLISSGTPTAAGMTAINLGGSSATTGGTLTIGNGGGGTTLVSLTGDNSASSSPAYTYINSFVTSGTNVPSGQVNINTGGKLVVGSTGNTSAVATVGLESGLIRANISIAGGTLEVANAAASTNTTGSTSEAMSVTGSLTTTAGSTIQLDKGGGTATNFNSGNGNVFTTLAVSGNATLAGTTLNTVGTAGTTNGIIVFLGAANSLATTTFQIGGAAAATTSAATFGTSLEFGGSSNQTLTSDAGIYDLLVRAGGVVGNAGVSSEGYVKTLTISSNPSTGNVGNLTFGAGATTLTTALKLGSNLTAYSGVTSAANFQTIGGSPGGLALDLTGFTYDATNVPLTTGTSGLTLSGNNSPTWTINSFNAGLTASIPGTIRAKAFNFTNTSTGSINIGAGVTLLATTSGTTAGFSVTNSLAGSTGAGTTIGTIDPTSTFVYTGADGTAFPSNVTYLNTGARTTSTPIGGITVGDPTTANLSSLRLSSSSATIFAAGNVTVNTSSAGNTTSTAGNNVLNLGGTTLTLQGTASLLGNGTVTGNSGSVSNLNWASGSTGGLSPGTTGTVGMLTMTSNGGGFILNLTNSGSSQFDIATTASYDQINRGVGTLGTAITVVYGGKLTLNFLNSVAGGTTTYQLFTVNNTTETGAFTDDGSLLANATGNTTGISSITFSEATGLLTITTAVPEPSTTGMLGGLALLGCVARVYFRRRAGCRAA